MPRKGRALEQLVAELERVLAGTDVVITSPDYIHDQHSKRKREVDVSLRATVGSAPILVILECRDRKGTQDVRWIEELATKRSGVGASTAIAVSPTGFSEGAQNLARTHNGRLRSFAEVTTPEVFRWLGIRTITLTKSNIDITAVRFHVEEELEDLPPELRGASDPTDAINVKILYRPDGTTASISDAWQGSSKEQLLGVMAPDEKKIVRFTAKYPKGDRFRIMAPTGLVDVEAIEFVGAFSYTLQEVPFSRLYQYVGEEGALVDSAEVEVADHNGTPIVLGLNRAIEGGKHTVTARRLNGSSESVHVKVLAVVANRDEGASNSSEK